MQNRVPTGIQGLDEILGGGLLRRSCVIISGGPGSGKTTLATQFLYSGLTDYKEPALYLTLTESPNEIKNNMKAYGWDLETAEKTGGLKIIDARPILLTSEGLITPNESLFRGEMLPFSHIARLILKEIRDIKAKRVIIDSITVLVLQYVNKFYIRQGLLGLVQALSSQDCTSLLLQETVGERNTIPLEWALAHGVISLSCDPKGGDTARAIQIVKMRGIKHGERVYAMEIREKGIVVHPKVTVLP
ncbi:MAG: recombinase RecA [Thaumarchaeota archaeon]|nr:recombinase RecA [Nitrososphaerota archaeon]